MEEKQVVEKRIKPGIIRRRARKSAAPAVEESAAPSKASETAPVSTPEEKAPKRPVKEVAKTKVSKPSDVAKESTETSETIASAPDASPEKNLAPPTQETKTDQAVEAPPAKPAKEPQEPGVQGPMDLPDGPPVGTIIKLPQSKKPAEAKKPSPSLKTSDKTTAAETPEEDDKKLKAKRGQKKTKLSQDELGLEGYGRVGNVSQIARLQVGGMADRVFQPTRTGKRRRSKTRSGKKMPATVRKAAKRIVKMEDAIIVSELAQQLGVRSGDIIKKLMDMGSMVTLNQAIDFDTASLIAHEYEWEVKRVGFEEEKVLETAEDAPEDLVHRAPVVTVMGHVDHGKTSLLDAIRSSQVADGEAGGITQHIGSYRISLGEGKDLTFLDTPGHAAFTAMRARGAAVTDLVVLVVAADDGVMPQTVEAINHSKAAEVPIIVAVNKIDKPEANPDNIKRQLAEHGLQAEDWGGDIMFAPVSAKSKEGIDALLEMLFLQSEMLELKANPKKLAKGVVLEARLDKGRGPVASLLVQEGTLKLGDTLVAGNTAGKVRAMLSDRGESLTQAGPSVPVEILGLDEVPQASDPFQVLEDDKAARQVMESRQTKAREEKLKGPSSVSLEDLFDKMQAGVVKELNVILKADVQGSLEALQGSLDKLPTDQVKVRVLHGAVGGITESDVNLAHASKGIIIGFNVRPDTKARELAESEAVEIKVYKVIYDVIEEIKQAMEGLLEPTFEEAYLGRADVQEAFNIGKVGTIAGCKVVDGKILRDAQVRLLRDSVIIHEGKLNSLKRFKDDAKEVLKGFECGMGIEGFQDIKAGDVIECFEMKEIKGKLE